MKLSGPNLGQRPRSPDRVLGKVTKMTTICLNLKNKVEEIGKKEEGGGERRESRKDEEKREREQREGREDLTNVLFLFSVFFFPPAEKEKETVTEIESEKRKSTATCRTSTVWQGKFAT